MSFIETTSSKNRASRGNTFSYQNISIPTATTINITSTPRAQARSNVTPTISTSNYSFTTSQITQTSSNVNAKIQQQQSAESRANLAESKVRQAHTRYDSAVQKLQQTKSQSSLSGFDMGFGQAFAEPITNEFEFKPSQETQSKLDNYKQARTREEKEYLQEKLSRVELELDIEVN